MAEQAAPKYSESLLDLADKLTEHLQEKRGFSTRDAKGIAFDVVRLLSREYAGEQIYFSKGHIVTERDLQIYHEFDGANYTYLAHKYNLTVRHIYRLVDRVRKAEFAAKQQSLPFNSD